MKKYFYMAMAALVLMACNSNEPKLVNKDKKAIIELSKAAPALITQPSTDIKVKLDQLGFEDITEEVMATIPARIVPKAPQENTYTIYYYAYNRPADLSIIDNTTAETVRFFNSIALDKQVFAIVMVLESEDGFLDGVVANYFAGQQVENIHQLYLKVSRNLYNGLEKDVEWEAGLDDMTDDEYLPSNYTEANRLEFEEAFNALEVPGVDEFGGGVCQQVISCAFEGYYYGDASQNLGSDEIAPAVMGSFVFGKPEAVSYFKH